MTNIYQELTFKQTLKELENLHKQIGNKIRIEYVRNGENIVSTGTLEKVLDFEGIVYTGGFIPFVDKERLIRMISCAKITGDELLYDRSDIITKQTKVVGDIQKYKIKILGTPNTKEPVFTDNLRFDL